MDRSVRQLISALACALLLWLVVPGAAAASVIYTTPGGDGMVGRDWWSNPNYYWVANSGSTIDIYHDGGSRWWYRGLVFFDISSLDGLTLPSDSASFNFYSHGFSGVTLQYANVGGPSITTAYGQASGSNIAALGSATGWQSYDVTSLLQGSINANSHYVGFIFNATVNYGGGQLASYESGLPAFLDVNTGITELTFAPDVAAVPEPSSMALLGLGLSGLVATRRRRR